MNFLILAPMKTEAENFRLALKNYGELKNNYTVEYTGVGKVNAAGTAALCLYSAATDKHYDLVVVIGYAAGSSAYQQGDIVAPMYAKYHDADCPAELVPELMQTYQLEGFDDCICLTGDSFVTKDLAKTLICKHGSKVIFDMEATAVAQTASYSDAPVLVLKMISDVPDADGENYQSFSEFVETHKDFSAFVSLLENFD